MTETYDIDNWEDGVIGLRSINDDFLKFAREFSRKFDSLSPAIYTSACGNYKIKYSEKITSQSLLANFTDSEADGEIEVFTCSRVGEKSGIIELSRSKLIKTNREFVLYNLFWCYHQFKNKNLFTSDKMATACFVEEFGIKKAYNLIKEITAFFFNPKLDFDTNRARLLVIRNQLEKYEKTKY